jgi:hypothetical protein
VRTRDAQLGLDGRGLLLLPAAAIAVHQLRYWLAYGPRASAQLAAQGHSYLHSLVPWAICALAAASGLYLRRLATAARTECGEGDARRRSALCLWLLSWAALVVVYATQEALEALLATGHPGGFGGVFGHGGWWALPAAAVVAAVVVALLLLGRALLQHVAAAAHDRVRPCLRMLAPAGVATARVRPLARAAAGRAPPSLRLLAR